MSVGCLAVFGLSGVLAFRGTPLEAPARIQAYERPAWSADLATPSSYPAYRLGPDGASVPVGRVILSDDRTVELRLFPDVEGIVLDDVSVRLLETDVKSLWALVPAQSKQEITVLGEALIDVIRDQIIRIIGDPVFGSRYRGRFQEIAQDAYFEVWRDPRLQLVEDTIRSMFTQEDGERLAAALLPIALPKLRRALVEMMFPNWAGMRDLVIEGKVDFSPVERAAAEIMADPEVRRLAVEHTFEIAKDGRSWRIGALIIDAYIDAIGRDPRFEPLVDEVLSDPRFAEELRVLETRAAEFSTTVFSRIVERGGNGHPDALAVRVIRYILINRRRLVALIVPDGAPIADQLGRYEPLAERES